MAAPTASLPDSFDGLTPNWSGGTISLSPNTPSLKSIPDFSAYFLLEEWRNQAPCLDDPTAPDFFPERGVPGEEIRDYCFRCPVRLECLDYSVRSMPKFGWFGAHPEEGRKAVRRLIRRGVSLEKADAKVLADSLSRIRQRRKSEQGRRYDIHLGDEVVGEFQLKPAM